MEKHTENRTRTELASEELVRLIRERNYAPGDKLPTESELSELLGVGRNTVREALRLLVSRNIVVVRQGSGTFVSEKQGVSDDPFGFSLASDQEKLTRDLMQVRVMLEPPIAALAAQNARGEDVRRLEQLLEEVEERIAKRQDYAEADIRFHEQIANCSHNSVMSNLVPVIGKGIAVFAREVGTTEYEQTLISHRAVFEAIRDGKALEAQQAMQFHLLYNENRYLEERKGGN
ncbi:FadR family transcriptional regulator [Clostridiaceae bacterium]|nr:FadR family transcriptional regulator [Clostridiaceae bacterium]RKI09830.1 FadR family transcriptional regulator [bacterium 1XD21-70]